MRRVHNDDSVPGAPAPASAPPASGGGSSSSSSSKGRKRKKDTSDSSAGKKSSGKSGQASGREPALPKVEEGPTNQELQEWYEHQQALQSLVQGWTQPGEPYFVQQVGTAQNHMEYMQRIYVDIQSRSGQWPQSG
jgi:predicted lipid-binding transport protein (Tim44 family)